MKHGIYVLSASGKEMENIRAARTEAMRGKPHSLLSCIRTHLVLTVLYYGAVAAGLLLLKLAIELDYNILLGTFRAELLITLLACGSIARKNLYQIVKGAEA